MPLSLSNSMVFDQLPLVKVALYQEDFLTPSLAFNSNQAQFFCVFPFFLHCNDILTGFWANLYINPTPGPCQPASQGFSSCRQHQISAFDFAPHHPPAIQRLPASLYCTSKLVNKGSMGVCSPHSLWSGLFCSFPVWANPDMSLPWTNPCQVPHFNKLNHTDNVFLK